MMRAEADVRLMCDYTDYFIQKMPDDTKADRDAKALSAQIADVMHWVLGEPSQFDDLWEKLKDRGLRA